MVHQKHKVCLGCNSVFIGNDTAKTCSVKCRKRLERARKGLAYEARKASRAVEDALRDFEAEVKKELVPQVATQGGYVQVPTLGSAPLHPLAPNPSGILSKPQAVSSPEPVSLESTNPASLPSAEGTGFGAQSPPSSTVVPNFQNPPNIPSAPQSVVTSTPTPIDFNASQANQQPLSLAPSPIETTPIGLPQNQPETLAPTPTTSSRRRFLPTNVRAISTVTLLIIAIAGGTYLYGNQQGQNQTNSSASTTPASTAATLPNSTTDSIHLNKATVIDNGANLTATGQVTLKNKTNSTSALDVQNASSSNVLTVDTVNNDVGINTAPTAGAGALQVAGNINITGQYLVNGTPISSGSTTSSSGGTTVNYSNASNITSGTLSDSRLSSNVALKNATNTFTAPNTFAGGFQIQNSTATPLLAADTTNGRLAVNQTSANYTLDVNGDINITSGNAFRIAGVSVCAVSGCTPGSGSGNYIQNGIALQTANFAIQSGNTGSVTALVKGLSGQTADLLDVKDSSNNTAFSISPSGYVTLQTPTDSAAAFSILNHNSTSHTLVADTLDGRVAIAQPSASYTLDVGGDINSTTAIRVGGTIICQSGGCTPGAGSGNYIQNSTSLQTGNFAIQSATNTDIAAVIRGASGQSANLLNVISGDGGTNVLTVGYDGSTKVQTAINSSTAFQVQNSSGAAILLVDTSAGQVSFANATASATAILIGSGSNQANLYATNGVLTTSNAFLPGVLTTTQRNALTSPPTGTMIYNSTTAEYEYNSGTGASPNWVPFNQIKTYTWATLPISAPRYSYAFVADSIGGFSGSWLFEYRDDLDSTYPWRIVGGNSAAASFLHCDSGSGTGGCSIPSVTIPAAGSWNFGGNSDGMQNGGTLNDYIQIYIDGTRYYNTGCQGCNSVMHVSANLTRTFTLNYSVSLSTSGSGVYTYGLDIYARPVKVAGNA